MMIPDVTAIDAVLALITSQLKIFWNYPATVAPSYLERQPRHPPPDIRLAIVARSPELGQGCQRVVP